MCLSSPVSVVTLEAGLRLRSPFTDEQRGFVPPRGPVFTRPPSSRGHTLAARLGRPAPAQCPFHSFSFDLHLLAVGGNQFFSG